MTLGLAALLALAGVAVDPPYDSTESGAAAEVAVVLSGDVDDLRVRHAVALWRAGRVRRIVTTGTGVGGDDGHTMRETAIKLGVPAAAVLVEGRSRSTRENLLFASELLRRHGWRRAALVTSRSHMGRALRVARRVDDRIEWLPEAVPDAGPPARRLRNRVREWGRFAWYAARGWI